MKHIIKFIEKNVDGCRTNIEYMAEVVGIGEIKNSTIVKVKEAIEEYKKEYKNEWDTDGCLNVAEREFKSEGWDVNFLTPEIEICF